MPKIGYESDYGNYFLEKEERLTLAEKQALQDYAHNHAGTS